MVQNKTVMRLDMNGCYKCKKVALHSVTKIEGIDSLSINMKDNTMTVIGEADSVTVANMLRRKFRCAQMISGGPVPPPPPPKKEEKEEKKEEKPKEEKKEEKEEKKEEKNPTPVVATVEQPKEVVKIEEKKEEKPKEEEKPKVEEKKEEKKDPAPVAAPPHQGHSSHPIWCKVCDAWCYPPCSACSSRPEIMWPRYHQPGSGPNEVWYVWNEEKQESCTIM